MERNCQIAPSILNFGSKRPGTTTGQQCTSRTATTVPILMTASAVPILMTEVSVPILLTVASVPIIMTVTLIPILKKVAQLFLQYKGQ